MTTRRTVLRGTTVVDVRTGSLRAAVDVTIDGGRIAAIDSTTPYPRDPRAENVDARGTYTVPGFCDMHAHPLSDRGDPEPALRLMLTTGVTTFRQMSGSAGLLAKRANGLTRLPRDGASPACMPGEVLTGFNAGSEEAGVRTVRRQAVLGADFIKVAMVTPVVFFAVQTEAARLGLDVVGHLPIGIDVRDASDDKMRCIEHLGPGVGVISACCDHEALIVESVKTKGALRLPPVPRMVAGLLAPITDRVVEHIVINPLLLAKPHDAELTSLADESFNTVKARALARMFAANETWHCPTLVRLRAQQFADDPGYRIDPNNRYVADRTLRRWQKAADRYSTRPDSLRSVFRGHYRRQRDMVRIFDEEGVKMLVGSDASGAGWEIPGHALHQEFDELAAAGLTPLRILQMATMNAAEFLNRTDTMGAVEVGKDADLVLLGGNPLASVANMHRIAAVVRAGKHFPARRLAAIAEDIADQRSAV